MTPLPSPTGVVGVLDAVLVLALVLVLNVVALLADMVVLLAVTGGSTGQESASSSVPSLVASPPSSSLSTCRLAVVVTGLQHFFDLRVNVNWASSAIASKTDVNKNSIQVIRTACRQNINRAGDW